LVMAATGLHAYLGSSTGLMPVDVSANTIATTITAAPGKVLAVSPGEKKVITADAAHAYIVDLTNNNAVTPLSINGATAAAFAPDEFEAYIAGGNNLYVYSTQFTLRSFNIGAPVNDVTFLTSGQFAYTANANSSSSAVRSCDVPAPPPGSGPAADKVPTNGVPLLVRSLPNASQVVLADSPGVDVITPTLNAGGGCGPGLSNDHSFIDFGIGPFTPQQIIPLPNSL